MNKPTVGLMMVVRNEEKRIKECLEWHLPYVDEAVICDQSSDDLTKTIATQVLMDSGINFNIYSDENRGFSEPSKQEAADRLTTEWVLYVDADEKFDPDFLLRMKSIIEEYGKEFDGFTFPRTNIFEVQVFDENVPIKPKTVTFIHPAKDPQLRLTRKSCSTFPPYLHNRVRVKNAQGESKVNHILMPITHFKTITEQWADQRRYDAVNKGRFTKGGDQDGS